VLHEIAEHELRVLRGEQARNANGLCFKCVPFGGSAIALRGECCGGLALNNRFLFTCILPLLALACDGDDAATANAPGDASFPDRGSAQTDASSPPADAGVQDSDRKADDAQASDGGRPSPVFLAATDYAELIEVDPAFPFGVTQVHQTNLPVGGAVWGYHGGPLVTVAPADAAASLAVYRYLIPVDAKATLAAPTTQTFADAQDIAKPHFYNAVFDLPFGQKSVVSYSGSGAAFPGEAFIYTAGAASAPPRANVNGFYSGVTVADVSSARILYSGLSPLAKAASETSENGLYVSAPCNSSPAATGTCLSAFAILRWAGASGPVTRDRDNNAFVAAFTMTQQEVYGLTQKEITTATSTLTKRPLFAFNATGTGSLAVVPVSTSGDGHVLIKGFDGKVPAETTAQAFSVAAAISASATSPITGALKPGTRNMGYDLFSDPEGDLWLAIATATGGAFVELRHRP
jgi:hypothetical protein